MTNTLPRLVFACFVLGVALAGSAIPAHAQPQNGQRRPATRQLTDVEVRLYQLINQLNAEVAAQQRAQAAARAQAARAQAARPGRLVAGMEGTIGGGVEGGLTTPTFYVPAPMSAMDQMIGARSNGNVNSMRERMLPTCRTTDRVCWELRRR